MAKEVDSIHLLSCAIEASLGNDCVPFPVSFPASPIFRLSLFVCRAKMVFIGGPVSLIDL